MMATAKLYCESILYAFQVYSLTNCFRRHNNDVVVYDPASQRLVLRSYNNTTDVDHPFCPTCHRPWQLHETSSTAGPTEAVPEEGRSSFRNPEYFRMVQRSLETAQPTAPPSSPRRRLVPPIKGTSVQDETPVSPEPESLGDTSTSGREDPGISSSAFSQNFMQKVFVVKKELGRGGRGVVFLVEHVLDRVPLGLHACKRIPVGDNHEWLEKVLVEVQLLSRLHHQNLVAYQHVWLEKTKLTNFGPPVACAYILQEYCNGGDLQSYVVGDANLTITKEQLKNRMRRRSKGDLEPPRGINETRIMDFDEIYSFFRDITAGIQFLHANGFIHRDLKPSNCLLHDTGREVRVLVSDFGEVQQKDTVRKSTGATGTVSYCAPEVLTPISPGGPFGNFTFKSDIFSLGMILHFVCFASLPYQSSNILNEESEDLDSLRAEVSSWKGFNGERKLRPDLPDELYMFLRRLLAVRPDDRPTADEISNGLRKRTGLAETKSQRPPRTPPPSFEELGPRRRIVSLDSPAPGSPRATPVVDDSAQPTIMTRRGSHLRHAMAAGDSFSSHNPSRAHQGSQSPRRDLILRPSLPSPEREPGSRSPVASHRRRRSTEPETIIHQNYLLTDGYGDRETRVGRLIVLARDWRSRRILPFLIVLLKVISILQPCASRGINPAVAYPLLVLSLWEFGHDGYSYGVMIGALVVHCAVLGLSLRAGTMCALRGEWSPADGIHSEV